MYRGGGRAIGNCFGAIVPATAATCFTTELQSHASRTAGVFTLTGLLDTVRRETRALLQKLHLHNLLLGTAIR